MDTPKQQAAGTKRRRVQQAAEDGEASEASDDEGAALAEGAEEALAAAAASPVRRTMRANAGARLCEVLAMEHEGEPAGTQATRVLPMRSSVVQSPAGRRRQAAAAGLLDQLADIAAKFDESSEAAESEAEEEEAQLAAGKLAGC